MFSECPQCFAHIAVSELGSLSVSSDRLIASSAVGDYRMQKNPLANPHSYYLWLGS
jgi:hypothetical protein